MAVQVKLQDILEGMDFQSDERSSFLNLTTGEVIAITDEELRAAEHDAPLEDFPEWQHDAIRIAGEFWRRVTISRCLTGLRSMNTRSWNGSVSR